MRFAMNIFMMSIYSVPMIAAIIVLRFFTIYRLPKKTFQALWGVVLFRLLIPFELPSHISVFNILNKLIPYQTETVVVPTSENTAYAYTESVYPYYLQMLADSTFGRIFTVVWLAVMFAIALFFTAVHFKSRRKYSTAVPCSIEVQNKAALYRTKRKVLIKQLDCISAPFTYGIIRPIIILPKSLDFDNEQQLDYILAHEFAHIKSFDTLKKLLLAAAVCTHWFNPAVWVMYIAANRDMELSCDNYVVSKSEYCSKADYALTLIKLEEKKYSFNPFCSYFSRNSAEERITAVMKAKKASVFGTAIACIAVAATVFFFGTSAVNNDSEEDIIKIGIPSVAVTVSDGENQSYSFSQDNSDVKAYGTIYIYENKSDPVSVVYTVTDNNSEEFLAEKD